MQIYQVFVGRHQAANLLEHPNQVFERMQTYQWSNLTKWGFDTVYLLGVWRSDGAVLDPNLPVPLASPFAITDHRQPDPRLGQLWQLKQLIQTIKDQGLQVILDYVPNHRSLSHIWLDRAASNFYWDEGQVRREFSGDVAKLNFNQSQVRTEHQQTLELILDLADGVRVDMAHYIPLTIWQETLTAFKQTHPDKIWLAEAYPDSSHNLEIWYQLIEAGFDGVYDSVLYHNIADRLHNQDTPLDYLVGHLNFILENLKLREHMINYIANHDDVIPNLPQIYPGLSLLLAGLPGKMLSFNGALRGLSQRLDHHQFQALNQSQMEIIHPYDKLAQQLQLTRQINLKWDQIYHLDNQVLVAQSPQAELIQSFSNQSCRVTINRHQVYLDPFAYQIKFKPS